MRKIFKKAVSVVLSAALAITSLTAFDVSVKADGVAVNLLTNGDFTDGLTGWNTYFYSGNCASAKVTDDFEYDMTVNYWDQWSWDGTTYYKIDWQSILIQTVTLQAGKTYTLRFDGYASENRTIRAGIKNQDAYRDYFNLTTTKTTYSKTFNVTGNITEELQFLFGYFDAPGAINPEGKHDVYISNIYLVEGDGSNIVDLPVISGIDEGAKYITGVTPKIKYDRNYNVVLEYRADSSSSYTTKAYNVGDEIRANGQYRFTVKDAADASIYVTKTFTIDSDSVDLDKDYYFIKSRSNGKVMECYGFEQNSAVIQTTYAEKVSQLYSIDDLGGGQLVIKNLNSGKVIAVNSTANDGAGIVQQTYTGSMYQRWVKVPATQGYITLMNLASGKVIDIPSASSSEGIQLDQYTNNGTNAQQWDIIKVDINEILNGVQIPDTSTPQNWKENAIIAPKEGKLTAAGPIYLTWYNNANIGAVSYEIKFDNEPTVTVSATNEEVMEYEWYNTEVALHTVTVTAVLANSTKIASDTRSFYVSKKGLGWGSLYRTDDMNLSWYYQWSLEEAAGTSKDLQFVPMVWGNWGSDWLRNPENSKYKTVLGFNEPDFNEQSALTVDEALDAWADFSNSELRVGSPCTAIGAYWSKDWFWKFMEGVEADPNLRVDYIVIHCYVDSGDPAKLLELIDDTWNKWHLPIWITEFGVAKWGTGNDIWNNYTPGAIDTVYNFMQTVIPELDSRPYVERYAWFPFDPNDGYGGASGIFNYDDGTLNALGELYRSLGNPVGYVPEGGETIEEGIEVNGYQISNTAEGMRVVYSSEPYINNQQVKEVGLVYGLYNMVKDNEMVVNSTNSNVHSYAGTSAGIAGSQFSGSSTATTRVMTMTFAAGNATEFTTRIKVRAYAKLADGSYVYTNVYSYTPYTIAGYLYDNVMMNTLNAHNYLYNNILKVVDPNYKEVDFKWSNTLTPNTLP